MSDARGDADGPDETEAATAGAASDGATESGAADGDTASDTASDTGGRPCPQCDRPMIHRHCKYVCPEHGVVYDCSDTFY
jgi:predicted RNA-binding Zn-ribbon protein involved in translation (DUF1610 family)